GLFQALSRRREVHLPHAALVGPPHRVRADPGRRTSRAVQEKPREPVWGRGGPGLALCLGGTPWEWKRGEGYTMELTWERKNELQALLDRRSFVKLARFLPFDHQVVREGRVPDAARATLRQLLPVVTP